MIGMLRNDSSAAGPNTTQLQKLWRIEDARYKGDFAAHIHRARYAGAGTARPGIEVGKEDATEATNGGDEKR